MLDILDYDGDIDLDVEGERAVVSIIGEGEMGKLVGDRGEVLDALQELTRLAVTAETGSAVEADARRRRLPRAPARPNWPNSAPRPPADVLADGEPVRLSPMNPFERKVVHDAVAEIDGVTSSSEGEEPRRRVVVSLSS